MAGAGSTVHHHRSAHASARDRPRRPTNQPIRAPRGAAGLLICSSESISIAIRSHTTRRRYRLVLVSYRSSTVDDGTELIDLR